ncbi:MAG: alpha amylase C-terminal domain-containing protein [Xenococcaceae cyanobacterium]
MDYFSLFLIHQLTIVDPHLDKQNFFAENDIKQEQVQLLSEQKISEDKTQNLLESNVGSQQPQNPQAPSYKFDEQTFLAENEAKNIEGSNVALQQPQNPQVSSNDIIGDKSPMMNLLGTIKQGFINGSEAILSNFNKAWQMLVEKFNYQATESKGQVIVSDDSDKVSQSNPDALFPPHKEYVISPDVAQLHLAAIEVLEKEPRLEPASFQPDAGVRFNDDDSVTIRVLVGNDSERLTLIGDFNNWGVDVENLNDYELQPTADNTNIHEITLPPGDYHKMQYRLLDQYGNQRLDMSADIFSTPAFNARFYEEASSNALNSVLWKPTPIPPKELAERPDLRGKQLVIGETDLVSLSLNWVCQTPESRFFGQTGADNISQLYRFIGECGLPEKLAELGYNAIEFMPLDAHIDFWEPEAPYFPDWRYSYQTINFYGKHADFGSPDELRFMTNAFHKADVAVILDVVYSHFSNNGNNPPREFGPLGFAQYKNQYGEELYAGPWTQWGTKRFSYTPEVRKNIVDAALVNILRYGFDGLRIDNVNGIDAQPYGRVLLRELAEAFTLYYPKAVVIGEGYFGDPYLNRALDAGGAGMTTTYSDRFYLWFTEDLIKHQGEIDTWRLDYMLNNDWTRALLYYPGNHDEFANPGNPFQARGRYLAEAINGGDFHNRKIGSWSALSLFASSYYLDMLQLWTLQPGNLNTNSAINWSRLDNENVAQLASFQADMKKFFTSEEAFAPYNMHRHMVRWVDHENKVVMFERIDFATGRRTYVAVNLGDQAFENYKIPVYPEDAKFLMALDSDKSEYGGQDSNPAFLKANNHELELFLGSYGVVGLVQQDKITPVPVEDGEIVMPDYDRSDYYYYYGYRP